MNNYKGRLVNAVKNSAQANMEKHLMNAETLLGSHVGVADHPDMVGTITDELSEAAKYKDILDIIEHLD